MFGSLTYLPQYMQIVRGVSPTSSGLRLLPMMAGLLLTSVTTGQLVSRWGRYRIFPIVGTATMTVGLFLLSLLRPETSSLLTSLYMFVLGVGIGAAMQVLVIAVQNAVDYEDLGAATSGVTFFRSIGGSFGTAVFGAVFANVLTGNLVSSLHGLKLPPGVTASNGASPAVLDALAPTVHAAYVAGYSASLRTVFLIAAPVGVIAFLLSWTLKELPLRTTTRAVDPADSLAPTSRPTVRTSAQEMERALSRLLSREGRRTIYTELANHADMTCPPRAAWLLLRVGEHRADSRGALARHLHIGVEDLDARLVELVDAGYVDPPPADEDSPITLTPAGEAALALLFDARQDRISRLLTGWKHETHPALLELLTRFTHELAASDERPGRDLETAAGGRGS
jgi:DNA-binding MarR family transcriptional regulator